MFSDKYGLTEAVLELRKTMTRRIEPVDMLPGRREDEIEKFYQRKATDAKGRQVWMGFDKNNNWIAQLVSHYAIGEVVAVAQSYENAINPLDWVNRLIYKDEPGWTNKMFVKAECMPHRIRITGIKAERLQDISDEDCLREGIYEYYPYIDRNPNDKLKSYRFIDKKSKYGYYQLSPVRDCFAALIDRISGKGTWERNPWVLPYEFELIKY